MIISPFGPFRIFQKSLRDPPIIFCTISLVEADQVGYDAGMTDFPSKQTAKEADKGQMMSSHSRHSVGLTHVYPVISRRAGGVSIGVNLNTNNACNWSCIYCQVPGLTRGKPVAVDVDLLDRELRGFLDDVLYGDFMATTVPEESRQLQDIAFSGNGEPTATVEFPRVIERLRQIKADYPPIADLTVRLITNGSFMGKPTVLSAIESLAAIGGEVWFKVDAIDPTEQQRTNGIRQSVEAALARLGNCASRCPTWLQSCFFAYDGIPPTAASVEAYVDFCGQAKMAGIRGVHLYTIARTPMQPESYRLSPLNAEAMDGIADPIRAIGLPVKVSL
jgi:wyosine [tRNA(Phe)-imidazoG37] synthetase (radical SAM superfamily)